MDIEQLRILCMSFAGATEGIKWEDHICFMVAEKMFCITGEWGGVSLKVTAGDFDELIEREGIKPTAYMAKHKWVNIESFNKLKQSEWEFYVHQSYQLVRSKLPKRVQSSLG